MVQRKKLMYAEQIKKKQKNNKQRSGTKRKRICFDVDALSLSDSDDSCASSASSSGDEGQKSTTKDLC